MVILICFLPFRLRSSCVLLVGIKGLGAEICKNLVLSGVKSVTIVDPSPVTEQDFVSQFLVQRQDLGKNVSHNHRTCKNNIHVFTIIAVVYPAQLGYQLKFSNNMTLMSQIMFMTFNVGSQ